LPASSASPDLKDRLKAFRRTLRYLLVAAIGRWLEQRSVRTVPKLKRMLTFVLPWAFRRELQRAKELLPAEFAPRAEEILRGMIENQAATILEVFFYEKILAADPDFITWEGLEHVAGPQREGRGVIILSAHFGSWELIGYTLARLGFPLHVIARPQAINRMTEFMNGFRERRGVNVLPAQNLAAALQHLKQGKVVGIVADLNAREWGYQVPFFGRPASFYPTPVILSMRGRADLVPTFIERGPGGRQHIRFEPPLRWPAGTRIIDGIPDYVARYEAAFRRRPDQWAWFHERYRHAELGRVS
jgi:Kdo2-lipid IVA lauroyltransferase/acyltransferase